MKHHSGEEKPACLNCQRQGESCDYSVRLNWGGRTKRSSVDSPTSTSRGYGGTLIGFAEPMRTSAIDSADLPASIPSGNKAPADGFINFRSGDLGSPGALSPNSAAAFGVFDSPKPQVPSENAISPSQGEAQFATTWAEHSPITPASSGSMSQYSFGQTFHSSFSPAADQGVGLRSLSAFAFHSSSVSQPVSFLRNSVDMTSHPSDASSRPSQIDAQISTSRSLPHDDHGLSFLLNDPAGQDGPSHELTGQGGVSTMLLPRSHASSSPGHDRHTPGSNHAPRSESLRSLHHSEGLCTDSRDREKDHPRNESFAAQSKWQAYLTSVTDNYGLDSGRPDRDLTLNNDHAAIDINSAVDKVSSQSRNGESMSPTSLPGVQKSDFSGYYASPVPINIPRYLSPLPSSLLKNPINLLYFHHFLNHTSKMLVPHDCDNNPFVSVLPSSTFARSIVWRLSRLGFSRAN